MRIKKLALLCAFALGLVPVAFANTYNNLPEVDIQARSAILVHAQTDEILYKHNIHLRREPASITKIMTVLLGAEHGGLDDVVTALEADFYDIVDGSSSVNPPIKAGEEMTLRSLLYCAMVASDNAACNIIARHVAGSAAAFIETLNARLGEMGCDDTHFTNTHGLPSAEHYTTAYDVYLMARECLKNPLVMEMAHTEIWEVAPTNLTPGGRQIVTTNHLITRRKFPDYIYPFARGIKTGHTNNAGHCLVSVAEKDGVTLVSVVLGAAVDEETNLVRSFTETRDLFIWGFENFTVKNLLNKTLPLAEVGVIQGLDHDKVNLIPQSSVEALLPRFIQPEDIKKEVSVFSPDGVQAPIGAGDILGELVLSYEGHIYGTVPLLADKSIERDNLQAAQDSVGGFIDKVFGTPEEGNADDPRGSLRWILWAVIGAVALIALYVVFAISLNVRRRKRNMRPSNYRGRKRY